MNFTERLGNAIMGGTLGFGIAGLMYHLPTTYEPMAITLCLAGFVLATAGSRTGT